MRRFTREELSRYDGKNGAPAYFAFGGQVYDGSRSYHWHAGCHQVRHPAGTDYAHDLEEAPHGADLLERLPVVGILID